MKTALKITLLLLLTVNISCSKTELDCLGCSSDVIAFSQKNIQFNSEDNNITITSKGSWWLNSITLDGNIIDTKGIHYASKQYKVEHQNFTFEKKNAKEIFIRLSANTTSKERKLLIEVQAGNYHDRIFVSQAAN